MNLKERSNSIDTDMVFQEIDQEKVINWICSRFRLQVACLEDPLFIGAVLVKDAIENNRLKPYEIIALKEGEIPELPRMRLIRLLTIREKRKKEKREIR